MSTSIEDTINKNEKNCATAINIHGNVILTTKNDTKTTKINDLNNFKVINSQYEDPESTNYSGVETESEDEDVDEDDGYVDVNEVNERKLKNKNNSEEKGEMNIKTNIPEQSTPATPTTTTANSNIKLVLKKSPGFEISKHPLVQSRNASNKIFVVAVVSNTATKPVFTTTTNYALAGTSTSSSNVQSSLVANVLNTTPTPLLSVSTDSSKENVIKLITLNQQKQTNVGGEDLEQQQPHPKVSAQNKCDFDVDESIGTPTKDEIDDTESIHSELDVKTSTPKIKRELIQLQKTVNESKILTEYMNESSTIKGRKSRKIPLKTGSDTEYSPLFAIRRSRSRSCSKPRLESPLESANLSKWPSEERLIKRQNMRSQNTEFMQKQMKFLNRIHAEGDLSDNSDGENSVSDTKSSHVESQLQIIKKNWQPPPKPGWDSFCWKCHAGAELIPCSSCIRSFHLKCLKRHAPSKGDVNLWICPECIAVENSMKGVTRTWKGAPLTTEQLNNLLQFAINRIKLLKGHDFFFGKLNEEEYTDYFKYISNPITLDSLQRKVDNKLYKCAEEFAIEAKWIHHNAMVYFGNGGKLPNLAKSIVKVCRQEVTEIDNCPECYYNANTRQDWFVEVCSRPHILLWAKLKGFPYWPAKAMGISSGALVNVRFFGDYDRAYIPVKECFLYSEKDPNPPTKQNKRNNMASCIKEVDIHIKKIITKFGSFKFAPFKMLYNPNKELEQLELMIPGVMDHIKKAQTSPKSNLTFKIVKTADNNLSMIKKSDLNVDNSSTPLETKKNTNFFSMPDNNTDAIKIVERKSSDANDIGFATKSNISTLTKTNNSSSSSGGGCNSSGISIKTYEVVTKKDDNDISKVNSVILKRKSDNWNTVSQCSVKKQKNLDNDVSRGEQTVSSSSDSSLIQMNTEKTVLNPKENVVVFKRKRSQDDNTPKTQRPKIADEKKLSVLVLTTDQTVSPSCSGISGHQVTSSGTSSSSSAASSSSSSSSGMNSLVSEDELASSTENNKNNMSDKRDNDKTEPISSNKNEKDKSQTKNNSKNDESVQEEEQRNITQINITISQEQNNEDNEAVSNKQLSSQLEPIVTGPHPAISTAPAQQRELIPFTEIKTEQPDSDNETQKSSSASMEIRSKTTTPEQRQSLQSVISVSTDHVPQENSKNDIENVIIKTEISSEDEEDNSQTPKPIESSMKAANYESAKSTNQHIQRITVKDISTLRVQSRNKKIQPNQEKKKSSTGVMKVEVKKQNQRARKSFPNKTTFTPSQPTSNLTTVKNPVAATSIIGQNSKNINNMVYIPVDSKGQTTIQKAISLQPVTALSKPTVAQNSGTTGTTITLLSTTATSSMTSQTTVSSSNSSSVDLCQLQSRNQQSQQQQQPDLLEPAVAMAPVIEQSAVQEISPSNMSSTIIPTPTTTTTTGSGTSNQNHIQNKPVEPNHMLSGSVTPNLAAAITDTIVKGPPRLSPKPCRALAAEGDSMFPSKAGPVCTFLMENSHKISDFFRSVIEDTLADMASSGILEAKIKLMDIEMEKMKHSYEKQLDELKHNTDLMLCEMRNSWEKEKTVLIAETRKQCELERILSIEECKKKQWCANCGKEAQFYCCWNTSYCDYPCQQKHWTRHMNSCAQNDNPDANAQKIGIKVPSFNVVKDKKNKNMDSPILRGIGGIGGGNFLRTPIPIPVPRNTVPVQRLVSIPIPISSNSAPPPRYTLLNREGNWELMPSPNFQRVLPPGVIMTDSYGKACTAAGTSSKSLARTNQM